MWRFESGSRPEMMREQSSERKCFYKNSKKLYNKNAFRRGEKLPHFFTIHYYLLPRQIPELVKSEE